MNSAQRQLIPSSYFVRGAHFIEILGNFEGLDLKTKLKAQACLIIGQIGKCCYLKMSAKAGGTSQHVTTRCSKIFWNYSPSPFDIYQSVSGIACLRGHTTCSTLLLFLLTNPKHFAQGCKHTHTH